MSVGSTGPLLLRQIEKIKIVFYEWQINRSFAAVNTATIASKMTTAAVNKGLWWVD